MCPQPTKYAECHILEWNQCLKFLNPKPNKNLGMKIPERKIMPRQVDVSRKVMGSNTGVSKEFLLKEIL